MQLAFSDITNRLGLIQACEDDCGFSPTAISGNTSLLKEFTRRINKSNSTIWSWIWFSYGGQQFEDSNQTDLPFSSDTLTAAKRAYANAAGATSLKGVAYKDASGNYIPLTPITHDEILKMGYTIDSFYSTSGTPRFYMPIGNTTYIFPASDTTRASGFKQYFDRGAVAFSSSDTTKTPGFDSNFHEASHVGATISWMKINKPESRSLQEMKLDWADFESRIKKFYRQQFQQLFPSRITVEDKTREAL